MKATQQTLPTTGIGLANFISRDQRRCLRDGVNGEEGEWFRQLIARLGAIISSMPKTYEQDGKGEEAIVSLHYFTGGADWWITEKDAGCADDEVQGEQHQAFGYADLGYGPELGYISISELIAAGAELDFHFTPRTWREVTATR